MTAAMEKAGADARVKDLQDRLADILCGVGVLSMMEPPASCGEDLKADRLAADGFRNRLQWISAALCRQVTEALDVAVGDAEPRVPRRKAIVAAPAPAPAPATIPFRIVPKP